MKILLIKILAIILEILAIFFIMVALGFKKIHDFFESLFSKLDLMLDSVMKRQEQKKRYRSGVRWNAKLINIVKWIIGLIVFGLILAGAILNEVSPEHQ